jgi:hypothetical protein
MWWWLLACKEPDVAPRDLDELTHDVWAHYALEDETSLVVDMQDLRTLTDESTLPLDGTFSDLTADEVDLVGFTRNIDPAIALGMFTMGQVDCSPEDMEKILFATNQDELYVGNYTSYHRDYTSDFDAYTARDTHHLTWDTDYGVSMPLFGAYTTSVEAGMHFAPDGDDGPYLFSRTIMPEAADGDPDTVVFDIDFQMESFYPHDGGMVHLFAMWRHIDLGGGFGTDDDGSVNLILDGLHDFDDDTSSICSEGRI